MGWRWGTRSGREETAKAWIDHKEKRRDTAKFENLEGEKATCRKIRYGGA